MKPKKTWPPRRIKRCELLNHLTALTAPATAKQNEYTTHICTDDERALCRPNWKPTHAVGVSFVGFFKKEKWCKTCRRIHSLRA